MRLTATDIVNLYRPTPCPLRVYLRTERRSGSRAQGSLSRFFERSDSGTRKPISPASAITKT